MRLGIIGGGKIAGMHATALAGVHGPGICGVYDCDPSQTAAFADRHHCQPYATVEHLLEDVDAVIVASPNTFHMIHVTQAVEQGRHVLCEKPLVTRLEDAFRLIDALSNTHPIAAVGFNYRFLPIAKMIKRWVSDGAFGRVLEVRIRPSWICSIHRRRSSGGPIPSRDRPGNGLT
jgi:glucose-6-phosphate 3-dehydrogenase